MMQGGVNRLKSMGLGHKSAVATMFIAFTGFVVAMFLFILPAVWTQLVNLFNELPGMVTKLQQVLMLLPQNYPELVSAEQIRNLIGTAATVNYDFDFQVIFFSYLFSQPISNQ